MKGFSRQYFLEDKRNLRVFSSAFNYMPAFSDNLIHKAGVDCEGAFWRHFLTLKDVRLADPHYKLARWQRDRCALRPPADRIHSGHRAQGETDAFVDRCSDGDAPPASRQ
jgi:hypothetical protein